MSPRDTAQICPNGHVANSHMQSHPESNKDFCPGCGEETIVVCASCGEAIRGSPKNVFGGYSPPSFCQHCGHRFPWTQRKIEAASEMAELEETLTAADRVQLAEDLQEVSQDSPKSQVAATRLQRTLAKIGKGTAGAIREIAVELASEAAKKILLGP